MGRSHLPHRDSIGNISEMEMSSGRRLGRTISGKTDLPFGGYNFLTRSNNINTPKDTLEVREADFDNE
jgi:hypothetical protein